MRIAARPSFAHLGAWSEEQYPTWQGPEYSAPFDSLSGLRGLGDCSYDADGNLIPGSCDTTGLPPIDTTPAQPILTPAPSTGVTPPSGYTCIEDANGICTGPLTPITSAAPPAGSSTSGQLTPAQLAALINAGAQTGVSIVKSTQSPTVIPGTSAIYNPATGQILGAAPLGGAAGATSTLNVFPILLLVGGFVLVMSMGKK
jgi:hypothetical protein